MQSIKMLIYNLLSIKEMKMDELVIHIFENILSSQSLDIQVSAKEIIEKFKRIIQF